MNRDSVIRRAKPEHLDLLIPLVEAFCTEDRHPFDADRVRMALQPLLRDDEHGIVWLIGGEPAEGYAVVTWGYSIESGGRDALLDEIFVARRNRGLGEAAMQEILDDLAVRGLGRIFLETESQNLRVRRFYKRLGFVVEPSTWMSRDLSPLK